MISIHAPARGATWCCQNNQVSVIFQSTLPRGERRFGDHASWSDVKFQSTLPRGERLNWITVQIRAREFQSTLPRGERPPLPCPFPYRDDFNPRSREGSDGLVIMLLGLMLNFNPRSREGSDSPGHHRQEKPKHFNPRSREGSDYFRIGLTDLTDISIHAPARGATSATHGNYLAFKFQSTLPRGERLHDYIIRQIIRNFNPRSREGSDNQGYGHSRVWSHFNPRSREGSDVGCKYCIGLYDGISIHAPARGATAIFTQNLI